MKEEERGCSKEHLSSPLSSHFPLYPSVSPHPVQVVPQVVLAEFLWVLPARVTLPRLDYCHNSAFQAFPWNNSSPNNACNPPARGLTCRAALPPTPCSLSNSALQSMSREQITSFFNYPGSSAASCLLLVFPKP